MCGSSTLFYAIMMKLVILVSVVVSVFYSQGVYSCSDRCECSKASDCNGTVVNCNSRGLSKVPTNIPTDTCRLWLYHNKIQTIPMGYFNTMVTLQELSLYSNQISAIPSEAFKNKVNLRELYLYDNRITAIRKEMFDGLRKLQKVVIYDNPLICNCDVITFVRSANETGLSLKSYSTDPKITTCRTPEKIIEVLKVKGNLCDPELTTSDPATANLSTSEPTTTIPATTIIIASLGVLLVLAVGVIVGILIKQKIRKHQLNKPVYDDVRATSSGMGRGTDGGYEIPLRPIPEDSRDEQRVYDEID